MLPCKVPMITLTHHSPIFDHDNSIVRQIEDACGTLLLALYPYGSRVYGTASERSDVDFIAIIDHDIDSPTRLDLPHLNANVTVYSAKLFQAKLDEHEISALECFFLPERLILKKTIDFSFTLSLPKLRSAISSKSSNSWVKTKKKLTVDKDYAPYIGIKSLFHCFRIIDFGKQIATYGTIKDYGSSNFIWQELIIKRPEEWTWQELESKYKYRYNKACTEFRLLAPKE
jgi:hypothetical protein